MIRCWSNGTTVPLSTVPAECRLGGRDDVFRFIRRAGTPGEWGVAKIEWKPVSSEAAKLDAATQWGGAKEAAKLV